LGPALPHLVLGPVPGVLELLMSSEKPTIPRHCFNPPLFFFAHAVNSIVVLPSDTPEENKRKGKINVLVVKGKKDQIYI